MKKLLALIRISILLFLTSISLYSTDVDVYSMDVTVDYNERYHALIYKNNTEILHLGLDYQDFYEYHSFCVSNRGDVYVVGTRNRRAVLWKNGTIQLLDASSSSAEKVFVSSNNDVYVVGTRNNRAALWKNGTIQLLSTNNSSAEAIFVSNNNDVYIVGEEMDYAVLWKNGIKQVLDTASGGATAIFVSNKNDVYITGYSYYNYTGDEYYPILWENGVKQLLETSNNKTYPISISALNNNDVYATGLETIGDTIRSILWKNNIKSDAMLQDVAAERNIMFYNCAHTVQVVDNDVYVAYHNHDKNYSTSESFVLKNGRTLYITNYYYSKIGIYNYWYLSSSTMFVVARPDVVVDTTTVNLELSSNEIEYSKVTGSGIYRTDSIAIITATTTDTCLIFKNWTDTSGKLISEKQTDTIIMKTDSTLIANFEKNCCSLVVYTNSAECGEVSDVSKKYYMNEIVQNIKASVTDSCCSFKNWTDTSGKVIYTNYFIKAIKLTSDTILVANFEKKTHVISISSHPSYMGTVAGGISGIYYCGTEHHLKATSLDTSLYSFVRWTNYQGDTLSREDSFDLVISSDTSIIAVFDMKVGIAEENDAYISVVPNPTDNDFSIIFENTDVQRISIELIDMSGAKMLDIYSGIADIGTQIYKVNKKMASGTYIIKFVLEGKTITRKVIVK